MYSEALERTDPAHGRVVDAEDPVVEKAIAGFCAVFERFTPERVREAVPRVYADDVYFYDTLKEIEGNEELAAYLARSAGACESCEVRLEDVARSGADLYLRWRMVIRFKRFAKGRPTATEGMSQLRVDRDGRIVLHRDFWDSTQGFFRHLPVLGWLIRKVLKRV